MANIKTTIASVNETVEEEMDDLTKRLQDIKNLELEKTEMQKTLTAVELADKIVGRRKLPALELGGPKKDEKVSMKENMPPGDMNALMAASYWGHKDIIEVLVSAKCDVNATTRDGITALMLASYMGFKEVVDVLVEHGTDVNQRDCKGNCALMYAVIGLSDMEEVRK
jgi:hypothetical protein